MRKVSLHVLLAGGGTSEFQKALSPCEGTFKRVELKGVGFVV